MVENIFGKGEKAGDQHFLLFPKCFRKPHSLDSLNVGIVLYTFTPLPYSSVFNCLPRNKIGDLSELEGFADERFLYGSSDFIRVEKVMRKGKKALLEFSPVPQCF